MSPSAELVTEGRIVFAGAQADRGRLRDAIALLDRRAGEVKRAKEHHLRLWYALADLEERRGTSRGPASCSIGYGGTTRTSPTSRSGWPPWAEPRPRADRVPTRATFGQWRTYVGRFPVWARLAVAGRDGGGGFRDDG